MAEPMPYHIERQLYTLRCKSKMGEYLSPEDLKFLESCWKKWPKEYAAMGEGVFRDTAPFGSQLPVSASGNG